MTPEQRIKSLLDEFSDLHGAMCTVMEGLEAVLTEWIKITPVWGGPQSMTVYNVRLIEGSLENIRADLIDVAAGGIQYNSINVNTWSYDNNVLLGSNYEWKKISSIASQTTEDPYAAERANALPEHVAENRRELGRILYQLVDLSNVYDTRRKSWKIKIGLIRDLDLRDLCNDIYRQFATVYTLVGNFEQSYRYDMMIVRDHGAE